MIRKKTAAILMVMAVGGFVVGGAIVWARLQYRPKKAVQTAHRFVDLLRADEPEKAYLLTTQMPDVGKTYQEFTALVRREWSRHTGRLKMTNLREVRIDPFHSNGNRIRRWLNGRPVDVSQINVDFVASSEDGACIIPFEVREIHTASGEWLVSYFQSHAS